MVDMIGSIVEPFQSEKILAIQSSTYLLLDLDVCCVPCLSKFPLNTNQKGLRLSHLRVILLASRPLSLSLSHPTVIHNKSQSCHNLM